MIELTRLNGHKVYVNCELLKFAESSPDTMLTLITGEKIVVLETCEAVVARAVAHRLRVLAGSGAQGEEVLRSSFYELLHGLGETHA